MKNKLQSFWRWASPGIVTISALVFVVWIGFELYYAITATDNQTVLFHKEIIIAIVTGASLLYLVFTLAKNWEMASAARDAAEASRATLQQMRDARDEETAPYVLVYFNIEYGDRIVYFIIKNIGKTPARNISLAFDPPIQSTEEFFEKYSPIVNGIPSLAPEQEIRTFFALYIEHSRAKLPKTFQVKITYNGGISDKLREDTQVLDMSMYEGRMFTNKKNIDDLVKVADNISDALEVIATEIRSKNHRAQEAKQGDEDVPGVSTQLPLLSQVASVLSGRVPIVRNNPAQDTDSGEEQPNNEGQADDGATDADKV